jgi:hypothetical protein
MSRSAFIAPPRGVAAAILPDAVATQVAKEKPPARPIPVESVIAWRLARHDLLERSGRSPEAVASDLFGIHAQIASAAEFASAVRVERLTPGRVGALLTERRALVKTWAMRGTLHLFAGRDMPLLIAALSGRVSYRQGAWQRGFNVTLEQMESLMRAIRRALDDGPMTREELDDAVVKLTDGSLRGRLRSGWGELLKPAAYEGALCFGPPRGRNVTFVRPDIWIPGWTEPTVGREEALVEVARRYLRTYGPASFEHFGAWWGAARATARRTFRSLADELTELELDGHRVSALTSDLPRIEAAQLPRTHVRLLGYFDPYKVGVRPRGIFVPDAFYDRVYLKAGWMSPVVLEKGRAVGVWGAERSSRATRITVAPFERLSAGTQRAVREEAERLAPFLGPGAVDIAFS